MKFIVHIGTHKTGTSSLQKFLLANEDKLAHEKIYYAHLPNRKNVNFLAGHIAYERYSQAKKFIHKVYKDASRKGMETILLSGESFYAMSFFIYPTPWALRGREYLESEKRAVKAFYDVFPDNSKFQIVCYLRRQDQFLDSIYNQRVKSANVSCPVEKFSERMVEALDYSNHMDIWSDNFGLEYITVKNNENLSENIIANFMRDILDITKLDNYRFVNLKINERLNRDVLEFKRILNRMKFTYTERFTYADGIMNKRAAGRLSNETACKKYYNHYLEPEFRLDLVKKYSDSNNKLVYKYGFDPFLPMPESCDQGPEIYPGLNTKNSIELIQRYDLIRNSPLYRIESNARFILRLIRKFNLPIEKIINLLQRIGVRRKLISLWNKQT